jgi:hypothetical protein
LKFLIFRLIVFIGTSFQAILFSDNGGVEVP